MRWVGRHTERAHVGCGLLISLFTRRTPFRSSSSGHGSVLTVKFSLVSWRAPSVRLWSRFTSRCRLWLQWICFWWVRFRSERNRTVRSHGENYDFYQHRAPEIKVSHLLWVMWLLTRCPAARAAIRESSPASTVPHTTRASWRAFSPGSLELEPWTPSIYRRRRSLTSEREDEQLEDGSFCFTYRNISSGFHVSICNL